MRPLMDGPRRLHRALRLLVSTSFRVAPRQSLACLSETGGVILGLLQPLLVASFVGAAVAGDERRIAWSAAGVVVSLGISRGLIWIGQNARFSQLERVGHAFDALTATLASSAPTIEHFDDAYYLDQLQIMREESGSLGLALNTMLNQLNTLIGVVGVIALALTADPRMLLVAAAGLPGVLAAPLLSRWQRRAEDAGAEAARLAAHLLQVGTAPASAGEIRVFGLADPLRSQLDAATRSWRAPKIGMAVREATLTAVVQLIFFGTAAGVLAWIIRDAITGRITVAGVTLALLLIGRLQGVSGALGSVIRQVAAMTRTAGRYLWLVDETTKINSRTAGTKHAPVILEDAVMLDGVGYTYPGSETSALKDISLTLPTGGVVALVGENGAGKSTLVNLLIGLLPPTEGRILIDGTDLEDIDRRAWHRRSAGAFQDFVQMEFTLGDSVGMGELSSRHDVPAIHRAIHDGAADAVLHDVPHGLDTQLGATWPDGIGLSGGQWQRIAIARGMMRPEPVLRVLDEPTAALDAATEHELFDRYAAAARAGRGAGTITILVTHRFSTVAAADTVVVLEGGRVVEQGNHTDLVAAGGHYAELYELQARGYR